MSPASSVFEDEEQAIQRYWRRREMEKQVEWRPRVEEHGV